MRTLVHRADMPFVSGAQPSLALEVLGLVLALRKPACGEATEWCQNKTPLGTIWVLVPTWATLSL